MLKYVHCNYVSGGNLGAMFGPMQITRDDTPHKAKLYACPRCLKTFIWYHVSDPRMARIEGIEKD